MPLIYNYVQVEPVSRTLTLTASALHVDFVAKMPRMSFSPGVGQAGSAFTVHGANFTGFDWLYLFVNDVNIGQVNIDAEGEFDLEIVPELTAAPGRYAFEVSGFNLQYIYEVDPEAPLISSGGGTQLSVPDTIAPLPPLVPFYLPMLLGG